MDNNYIYQIKFEAMGTNLEIDIWDNVNEILKNKIKLEILDFTEKYDKYFSRFRDDSYINEIKNKIGIFKISEDFVEIFNIYKILNEVTNGAINPFMGNTISDLGYDEKYTLRPKSEVRGTPAWETLINSENLLANTGVLEIRKVCLIDIGAIGKGFWVDKVCVILRENNLKKFLVNGSGDMYYSNTLDNEKLKVKLEGTNIVWELFNEAMCGSGTQIRNWSINEVENLHHVINANTNLPTLSVKNTWIKVLATIHKYPTAFCDGLATALFFEDESSLKQKLSVEFESLTK